MRRVWIGVVLSFCVAGLLTEPAYAQTSPGPATLPATAPERPVVIAPTTGPAAVLIHLPGIAGEMRIDQDLMTGLIAGGVAPTATIFDWTGPDRGVRALTNVDRHQEQAKRLASLLTEVMRQNPQARITLTAHSGGTGVAVGALEQLPDGVKVQTLVLLASALSPDYDLSRALDHVSGRAFSLHSPYDSIVLGTGTKTFGTYDRVWTDAAGYVGFRQPPTVDPAAYAKLTQVPYDPAWMKLGHGGDHIGMTNRKFSRKVLAPMVLGRENIETE